MEQDSWRGAGWEDTTGSSPEQRGREWETKGILERWESWLSLGSLRSSQGWADLPGQTLLGGGGGRRLRCDLGLDTGRSPWQGKFRRAQRERLLREFNKIIHAKYMLLAQWMEQQGIWSVLCTH